MRDLHNTALQCVTRYCWWIWEDIAKKWWIFSKRAVSALIVRRSGNLEERSEGKRSTERPKGWGEIHYQSRCFPGVPYVSFATLLKCKRTKWEGENGSANSCLRFHNRFIDSESNDPSDYRNIRSNRGKSDTLIAPGEDVSRALFY